MLLLTLSACDGAPPAPDPQSTAAPLAVEVRTAQPKTAPRSLEVPATVRAIRQVRPGSKLLGRVAQVAAREGERVRRGQVLARLESADLEAEVARARAAVVQGEAEVENAAAQKRRYDELAKRGSVTPRAVEDVTTRLQVSAAALARARAEVQAAEVRLSYATFTSPLDGWVVERRVEAGDMVAPGAVLFTLEDLSRVKVVAEIPEAAVARGVAAPGSAAEVRILERGYPSQIAHLLPAGDPASRTFEAHLFLDNADGVLKSGMFARVQLQGAAGEAEAGLWVPAAALVRRGQLLGLFVVDDSATPPRARLRWLRTGKVRTGEVRSGEERQDEVEVLAGLEAGERFLPAPPPDLEEGRALSVKTELPGRKGEDDA